MVVEVASVVATRSKLSLEVAPAVVATLHEAFRAAMHDPAHVAELAKYDQEPDYLGPADYGRSLRESYAAEKRAAERLGLRPS